VVLCVVLKIVMAKYCLPGLDVAHTPTLGHQTSRQLTCPKDPDCLRVPKPDPCKPTGPVKALSCVPGYVSHTLLLLRRRRLRPQLLLLLLLHYYLLTYFRFLLTVSFLEFFQARSGQCDNNTVCSSSTVVRKWVNDGIVVVRAAAAAVVVVVFVEVVKE